MTARLPISSISAAVRPGRGKPFNLKKIAFIRTAYKLPSRHQRLRRRGMLTTREVAAKFGVAQPPSTSGAVKGSSKSTTPTV